MIKKYSKKTELEISIPEDIITECIEMSLRGNCVSTGCGSTEYVLKMNKTRFFKRMFRFLKKNIYTMYIPKEAN